METRLYTEKGDAVCQKLDIFKGLMWFAYTDNYAHWHVLKVEQVKEIMAQNKEKKRVASLEDYAVEEVASVEKNFQNVVGQDSLTRFDQPKKKKRPNKKRPGAAVEKTDRPQGDRPVRAEKPERRERPERQNRPEKQERPEQANRNEANASEQPKRNKKRHKPNRNRPSNDKNAPKE